MVRPLKVRKYKPPKKVVPKEKQTATPVVWYGGKSRDGDTIISQFPPHNTFVDVFGGGGAITFLKVPSVLDVYNDIGNVSTFYRVLRDYGEELYDALYLTPSSRAEFELCNVKWQEMLKSPDISEEDLVEWARCWYVTIMQGYTHEERSKTWKNSRTMDLANVWNTHVEELPRFVERLRKVTIEKRDFLKVLELYDSQDTLFYLDPPYMQETRASQDNYMHEMPRDQHVKMLEFLTTKLKGQAVVSMYDHELYNTYLKSWRRVEIEHLSMIRNSSTTDPGSRKEIVWVKEHIYGLWAYAEDVSQATLAGISMEEDL